MLINCLFTCVFVYEKIWRVFTFIRKIVFINTVFINTSCLRVTKYPVYKHGVYKQKCVYVFVLWLRVCLRRKMGRVYVCVFVYEKNWRVFTFACLFTKKIYANMFPCLLVYKHGVYVYVFVY